MKKRYLYLVFSMTFFLFATGLSYSSVTSLVGTVSPDKGTVGTPLLYTLTISGIDPAAVKITPPEKKIAYPEKKNNGNKDKENPDRELMEEAVPLYIISSATRDDGESGGEKKIIITLTLSYYRTGVYTLPEIKVSGGDGKTIGYKIPTVTIEELNKEGALEEIEPPVSLSGNYFRILWIILVLIIVIAVGILVYRYIKKRKKAVVIESSVPPIDIFISEVESLNLRGLIESGRINEYVFAISIIFRRYLSAMLKFDAAEMTTDEISSAVKKHMPAELYAIYGGEIIDNMRLWDFSKFAEFTPSSELLLRNLEATVLTAKKISGEQGVRDKDGGS